MKMWRLGPAHPAGISCHDNTASLSFTRPLKISGDATLKSSVLRWNHLIFSNFKRTLLMWWNWYLLSLSDSDVHRSSQLSQRLQARWKQAGTWYPLVPRVTHSTKPTARKAFKGDLRPTLPLIPRRWVISKPPRMNRSLHCLLNVGFMFWDVQVRKLPSGKLT